MSPHWSVAPRLTDVTPPRSRSSSARGCHPDQTPRFWLRASAPGGGTSGSVPGGHVLARLGPTVLRLLTCFQLVESAYSSTQPPPKTSMSNCKNMPRRIAEFPDFRSAGFPASLPTCASPLLKSYFPPLRTAHASALSECSAFPLSGPPSTPPVSYGSRSARSRSSTGVDRPLEDSLLPSRASCAVCALPAGWSPWSAHALGHAEIHRGCERSSAPGHQ